MKVCRKTALLIGFIITLAAMVATATTVFMFREKKKREDKELERYLDCSIQ